MERFRRNYSSRTRGPTPSAAQSPDPGGYINFMDDDDRSRIRDNYKGNYERLVAVKGIYDPDNLFHLNQNIPPSGSTCGPGQPPAVLAARDLVARNGTIGRGHEILG